MSEQSEPFTYASYLKLDELLSLQRPESDPAEHDETLFIVIHQVYELWFKQLLHEIDFLCTRLERGDAIGSLGTLKRILTVLKIQVAQLDILETMTPLEFLSFRSRLESASGFQSWQFRALEFALGKKLRSVVDHHPEGSTGRRVLEERFTAPTLWDAFLRYLAAAGHDVPANDSGRDVTGSVEPSPALQALLVAIYREDPTAAQVCERLVDLDEGLQEWRYRHVKMVERTIGTKRGTGGSAGAAYLASTLFQPMFPDLWAIRTEL